jgi:hypothetical protein
MQTKQRGQRLGNPWCTRLQLAHHHINDVYSSSTTVVYSQRRDWAHPGQGLLIKGGSGSLQGGCAAGMPPCCGMKGTCGSQSDQQHSRLEVPPGWCPATPTATHDSAAAVTSPAKNHSQGPQAEQPYNGERTNIACSNHLHQNLSQVPATWQTLTWCTTNSTPLKVRSRDPRLRGCHPLCSGCPTLAQLAIGIQQASTQKPACYTW